MAFLAVCSEHVCTREVSWSNPTTIAPCGLFAALDAVSSLAVSTLAWRAVSGLAVSGFGIFSDRCSNGMGLHCASQQPDKAPPAGPRATLHPTPATIGEWGE